MAQADRRGRTAPHRNGAWDHATRPARDAAL